MGRLTPSPSPVYPFFFQALSLFAHGLLFELSERSDMGS